MNGLPPPAAEGALIRQARELAIPRLSIRAAAARAGMSPEQWGNIERGYRYTKPGDPPRPFSAPAATLAKMAHVLRISPERLESEGQRSDAAELLREILRQQGGQESPRPAADLTFDLEDFPGATDEMAQAMRRFLDEIRMRVEIAQRRHPGEPLTGAMIFPASTLYSATWDAVVEAGWAPEAIPLAMAALLSWHEEGLGNRAASG